MWSGTEVFPSAPRYEILLAYIAQALAFPLLSVLCSSIMNGFRYLTPSRLPLVNAYARITP